MTTIAEILVETLAHNGVAQAWGVVGDALNPVTDAIRRTDAIEWVGVRHEEAGHSPPRCGTWPQPDTPACHCSAEIS